MNTPTRIQRILSNISILPTVPPIITTTASNGESSNSFPQTESEYKNIIQAVQFITTQAEEEEYTEIF